MRRFLFSIVCCLAIMQLTGCSNLSVIALPQFFDQDEQLWEASAQTKEGEHARVIIYRVRKFFAGAEPARIYVDSKRVTTIWSGDYVIVKLTNGEHPFYATQDSYCDSCAKKHALNFHVCAGATYYLRWERYFSSSELTLSSRELFEEEANYRDPPVPTDFEKLRKKQEQETKPSPATAPPASP